MAHPTDMTIARAILRLCQMRGPDKTICPSEVARTLAEEESAWRTLMPEIRSVAAVLAEEGGIIVLQRGQPVSPPEQTVRAIGPIRLGWPVAGRVSQPALAI